MDIEILKVGYLEENCYILKIKNKCLIIDPGSEYKKIKLKLKNLELLGVLITHRHFDHIGALEELFREYKVPLFEFDNLKEKEYIVGPFKFEVIFTPGHTKDSVSYYFKQNNVMFSGDFIFKDNIGRCDLEGGDLFIMLDSIKKIKKITNVIIYPGHGDLTTLEHEKNNNRYFN